MQSSDYIFPASLSNICDPYVQVMANGVKIISSIRLTIRISGLTLYQTVLIL